MVLATLRELPEALQWSLHWFYAWGFADRPVEELRTVPLGTAKEVRQAKAGLGKYSVRIRLPAELTDIDHRFLAFGVRVGMTPSRLSGWLMWPSQVICAMIADQGESYLRDYVSSALNSVGLMSFSENLLAEMDRIKVAPLARAGYLWQWANLAQQQRLGTPEQSWNPRPVLDLSPENVRAHVLLFGAVPNETDDNCLAMLDYAEAEGAITRGEMLDVLIGGLEIAGRPIERASWIRGLRQVNLTGEELREHADRLLGILGNGHPPTLEFLGVRLAEELEDDRLPDLVTSLTLATSAKAAKTVLVALAKRPAPRQDTLGTLAALLAELATEDKLTTAVSKVMKAWGMDNPDGAPVTTGDRPVLPWSPTPDLWEVPRFSAGPATSAHLSELVESLLHRSDPLDEARLLDTLVAVVGTDEESVAAAESALRGGTALDGYSGQAGVSVVHGFLDREREHSYLSAHAAEIPTVLSTPSFEDLRITGQDLADRLSQYATAGTLVFDADLVDALRYLDPDTMTEPVREQLKALSPVRVRKLERWRDDSVDDAVAAVLACDSPSAADSQEKLRWMSADSTEDLDPWLGGRLLQVARHRQPFGPGYAMNMIGVLRHPDTRCHELAWEAVRNAWHRGLLRPGVADLGQLDWVETPVRLAVLAAVLRDMAEQGMLPLVWPVLCDMASYESAAERVPQGTAETMEVMAYLLPSVLAAVREGHTTTESLELPGVWALAARKGSSKAVHAARALTEQLVEAGVAGPAPTSSGPGSTAGVKVVPPWNFAEVWGDSDGELPDSGRADLVCDGAAVTFTKDISTGKLPVAHIVVPGEDGTIFEADLSYIVWHPTFPVRVYVPDPVTGEQVMKNHGSMYLDDLTGRLTFFQYSWTDAPGGTYCDTSVQLNIAALAVVSKGLLERREGERSRFVQGRITALQVRRNVRPVLESELGGRVIRALELDPTALPVLWPILTGSVAYSAELVAAGEKAPRWLSQVLDVCVLAHPALAEAERRGLVPEGTASFPGLDALAAAKGSAVGLKKARALAAWLDQQG